MTGYQWAMLVIAVGGFLVTWTGAVIGATIAVRNIREYAADKIAEVEREFVDRLDKLTLEFEQKQRSQDHNFGEVGAAMRQYIADVEKLVRENEIWGRDNFVKKDDLKPLLDQLRADFKDAVGEIKEDIRSLMQNRP